MKEAKKLSKKSICIIVCAAIVVSCLAVLGKVYSMLQPNNKLTMSLADNSEKKVSEPFKYSGYSTAEYTSYTKQSQYVEMDDGVKIAVDIYLPSGGSGDVSSFPTVFQFTPYGRAFTVPEKTNLAQKVAMNISLGTADNNIDRANSHDSVYGSSDTIVQTLLSYGYAYVCADVRGTGASYGTKVDFMPEIATDGKQLIDWMAGQDWCDGNVSMFGGSYLGYTQLVIAAEQPEALKAIFPEVVAFDGYSSEISPGGVFVQLYSDTDTQTLYEMNNYLPDEYVYPTSPVVDEDGDGELWDGIPLDLDGDGWRFENEFPLARQIETDYYFGSDNVLSKTEPISGKDEYKVDLTQDSSFESEWSDYGVSRYVMADPDEVPDRTELDSKCLTYTTSAFSEDTEVTGYPIMSFYASSTSGDADFHVYLEDVDEKGNAVLVTEGVLRAGFAELYDNDTMLQGKDVDVLPDLPWHGYEEGQYNSEIFADGNTVKLEFELFPTSWTFKEGHSLRISIACADTPTFETNSALNEDTVVTIYRDSLHPSKVTLLIIPE